MKQKRKLDTHLLHKEIRTTVWQIKIWNVYFCDTHLNSMLLIAMSSVLLQNWSHSQRPILMYTHGWGTHAIPTVHHGILLFIACFYFKGIDQQITMICKAPALSCKELCTTQFLPYCFLNTYFANTRVLSLSLLHILPRNFILEFQSATCM